MPDYTIYATVSQRRAYKVSAPNVDDAEELFRADYHLMRYDLLDDDVIEEIEVQD